MAALNLNLSCPGTYSDVETSRATVTGDGDASSAAVTTTVRRPGVAQIAIRGQEGQLTYPDGRIRQLSNVTADENTIVGQYVRTALLIKRTWRVEIDRVTGSVIVTSNYRQVAFAGSCTPISNTQKF